MAHPVDGMDVCRLLSTWGDRKLRLRSIQGRSIQDRSIQDRSIQDRSIQDWTSDGMAPEQNHLAHRHWGRTSIAVQHRSSANAITAADGQTAATQHNKQQTARRHPNAQASKVQNTIAKRRDSPRIDKRWYVRPIIAALPTAEEGKNRTQDRAPGHETPSLSILFENLRL